MLAQNPDKLTKGQAEVLWWLKHLLQLTKTVIITAIQACHLQNIANLQSLVLEILA